MKRETVTLTALTAQASLRTADDHDTTRTALLVVVHIFMVAEGSDSLGVISQYVDVFKSTFWVDIRASEVTGG